MKIMIDIRFLSPLAPSYNSFVQKLVYDLATSSNTGEWVVINEKETRIFEKGLKTVQVKKGPFECVNQRRLLRALHEFHCDLYIKAVNYAWIVYKASSKGFSGVNSKTPDLVMKFSGAIPIVQEKADQIQLPIAVAASKKLTPRSWAETQSVKTRYSGGKDYFIFAGDIAQSYRLTELLKAFSLFKKWQQSNMLLVIAGYTTSYMPLFEEQLSTYKYRDDVVIVENLSWEEQEDLLASAYAMIYSGDADSWPQPLVRAVQQGVAIIACDLPQNRVITDAAIWVDSNDLVKGLSDAMQLLYKDESQKQGLTIKMRTGAQFDNYETLLKAINKSFI
jgi:glycosyltransferase involved in cell wall biosynthesis